jgi:hypothetical protein
MRTRVDRLRELALDRAYNLPLSIINHVRAKMKAASMQFLRAFGFIVLMAVLAACDQTPASKGEPGPQGIPGERGEIGPPGPPCPAGSPASPVGPTSHVRMIRVNCDAGSCEAECNEDEVLLIAYCGAARTAPSIRRSGPQHVELGLPQTILSFRHGLNKRRLDDGA